MATHIKILNKSEIEEFELAPNFSASERKKYFYISDWIQSNIADFENDTNKICFVLMFGYFRASKRFPQVKYFSASEIEYVANKLQLSGKTPKPLKIPKPTISRYKGEEIKRGKLLGYVATKEDTKPEIAKTCHDQLFFMIIPADPSLIF